MPDSSPDLEAAMFKRPRTLFSALLIPAMAVLLAATGRAGAQGPSVAADLIVHEWGTFTSVAGPDGRAVEWAPLSAPADLPCFVTVLNPTSIKIQGPVGPRGLLSLFRATVRMETPVIYFYSPGDQKVNVKVGFPQGIITEWYPQATVPAASVLTPLSKMTGGAEWKNVQIRPFSAVPYQSDGSESHYYAARETDAASVQVGLQYEKFLFYRGLASFPVPVTAKVNERGAIAVETRDTGGLFVLFEKRNGRLGYRVVPSAPGNFEVARPSLDGTFESLRNDLHAALTARGLYPREASAMIQTWRDSWFEDGTRLFYVIPQASVDTILPLEIEPRPAKTVRVFVGRMEVITPDLQTEVEQAIRQNDVATLARHGRFLEAIGASLQPRFTSPDDRATLKAALQAVAARSAPAPAGAATTVANR